MKINVDDDQAGREETARYSRNGMPQMLKTFTRKAPEASTKVAERKPSAFSRIIVAIWSNQGALGQLGNNGRTNWEM